LGVSDNNTIEFISNFKESDPRMIDFMFIPQAWTISLEITFYLIAPFLVRLKKIYLFVLILLSIGFRLIVYNSGYDYDPWTYRFFPFELVFFIMGILSYYVYKKTADESLYRKIGLTSFWIIIFSTLLFDQIDMLLVLKENIYLLLVFIAIPALFNETKKLKIDAMIGEYSFPIYITHIFVISIMKNVLEIMNLPLSLLSELSIIACIILSKFLLVIVSEPIERIRRKRVLRKS